MAPDSLQLGLAAVGAAKLIMSIPKRITPTTPPEHDGKLKVKLVFARALLSPPLPESADSCFYHRHQALSVLYEPLETRHWAVCIDDKDLWELNKDDKRGKNTNIEEPKVWEYEKSRFYYKSVMGWTSFSSEEIQRTVGAIASRMPHYNLFFRNCQTFAMRLVHGLLPPSAEFLARLNHFTQAVVRFDYFHLGGRYGCLEPVKTRLIPAPTTLSGSIFDPGNYCRLFIAGGLILAAEVMQAKRQKGKIAKINSRLSPSKRSFRRSMSSSSDSDDDEWWNQDPKEPATAIDQHFFAAPPTRAPPLPPLQDAIAATTQLTGVIV